MHDLLVDGRRLKFNVAEEAEVLNLFKSTFQVETILIVGGTDKSNEHKHDTTWPIWLILLLIIAILLLLLFLLCCWWMVCFVLIIFLIIIIVATVSIVIINNFSFKMLLFLFSQVIFLHFALYYIHKYIIAVVKIYS